ncbi:MAG: DUF1013 domain-containing protein [Alphaproteobacteria bacterium]|nr:DUF1013 domain-containing protein [Alphaproteobacteria bacterium]
MTVPLMPRATAAWLIENTSLTFKQIGKFCGMHELEIEAIANGETSALITGLDPIMNGQLSAEEIKRCETDETRDLILLKSNLPEPIKQHKGPRYTPISKRADKPAAIAWCLKHYPDLTDAQLRRLIGTTKQTITAIRERSHWNYNNLVPRNPADLGLCRYEELQREVDKAEAIAAKNRPPEEVLEMQPTLSEATPSETTPSEANSSKIPLSEMTHFAMGDNSDISKQ